MDGGDRLFTVEETAKILRVGRTTAFGLIASGRLSSATTGRRRLVSGKGIEQFISGSIAETRTVSEEARVKRLPGARQRRGADDSGKTSEQPNGGTT
jgi:excisionase family DNA binding protein